MSPGGVLKSRWAPWAGIIAGSIAWVVNQQLPADVLYWNCRAGGAPLGGVVGLITGLVAVAGGWISWSAQGAGQGDTQARRVIAQVNTMAAALFLWAILNQTMAAFIVPECHR